MMLDAALHRTGHISVFCQFLYLSVRTLCTQFEPIGAGYENLGWVQTLATHPILLKWTWTLYRCWKNEKVLLMTIVTITVARTSLCRCVSIGGCRPRKKPFTVLFKSISFLVCLYDIKLNAVHLKNSSHVYRQRRGAIYLSVIFSYLFGKVRLHHL